MVNIKVLSTLLFNHIPTFAYANLNLSHDESRNSLRRPFMEFNLKFEQWSAAVSFQLQIG